MHLIKCNCTYKKIESQFSTKPHPSFLRFPPGENSNASLSSLVPPIWRHYKRHKRFSARRLLVRAFWRVARSLSSSLFGDISTASCEHATPSCCDCKHFVQNRKPHDGSLMQVAYSPMPAALRPLCDFRAAMVVRWHTCGGWPIVRRIFVGLGDSSSPAAAG